MASGATDRMAELRAAAKRKGGRVLSRKHVRGKRLRFRCEEGHEWEASAIAVLKGDWCPQCTIEKGLGQKALASLQRVVKRHGGSIESPYAGHRFPITLECKTGHRFETTPKSVKEGHWCPTCMVQRDVERKLERSLAELRRVLKRHGGELVGEYEGTARRTRFRCAEGHEWETPPASIIYHGTWCPTCSRGTSLEYMQELAAELGGKCLSKSYRRLDEKLRWRCALGHEWEALAGNVIYGHWCPKCQSGARYDIEAMQAIARQRGGRSLSKTYRNVGHKLRWECREGHRWTQIPNSIINGSWCPVCSRTGGPRPQLTIEDMHQLARENGGECLSEFYVNSGSKLRWRCARGHEWEAPCSHMRSRGAWCPECAYLPPNSLDGVRALARSRGGRCLSTTWNDRRRLLAFECKHGHRFTLRRGALKTGIWCPDCESPVGGGEQ